MENRSCLVAREHLIGPYTHNLSQTSRPDHLLGVLRVGPVAHPRQLLGGLMQLHLLLKTPVGLHEAGFSLMFPRDVLPPHQQQFLPFVHQPGGAQAHPQPTLTIGLHGVRRLSPFDTLQVVLSLHGRRPLGQLQRCPAQCLRPRDAGQPDPRIVDRQQGPVQPPAQALGHGRGREQQVHGRDGRQRRRMHDICTCVLNTLDLDKDRLWHVWDWQESGS